MRFLIYLLGVLLSALWSLALVAGAVACTTRTPGAANYAYSTALMAVFATAMWIMALALCRRSER